MSGSYTQISPEKAYKGLRRKPSILVLTVLVVGLMAVKLLTVRLAFSMSIEVKSL